MKCGKCAPRDAIKNVTEEQSAYSHEQATRYTSLGSMAKPVYR